MAYSGHGATPMTFDLSRIRHVVLDLHRLTGDDTGVLELLAATWHRLGREGGHMEIHGLRHRLVTRPEVADFPEIFGGLLPAGEDQDLRDHRETGEAGGAPAQVFLGCVAP